MEQKQRDKAQKSTNYTCSSNYCVIGSLEEPLLVIVLHLFKVFQEKRKKKRSDWKVLRRKKGIDSPF